MSVVVSAQEYERLTAIEKGSAPGFASLLLAMPQDDRADLLIAARALTHGLTVVTRNERHFRPTGVDVCNPFAEG